MQKRLLEYLYRFLGLIVAYTIISPVWIANVLGRIQIKMTPEAHYVWNQGGVLVVANHPSLIETVVLPALFWHPIWLGDQRAIPWSISDEYLLGRHSWVYEACRCIRVSREKSFAARRRNLMAFKAMIHHLERGGRGIIYPEGGRTSKGTAWVIQDDRQIRICETALVERVLDHGFTVIPVWITHGKIRAPESFCRGYFKLFFGPKFEINFGKPLQAQKIDGVGIAKSILQAGR